MRFLSRFFTVTVALLMMSLASCTSQVPDPASRRLFDTAPILHPAIFVDGRGLLAAWHDSTGFILARDTGRVRLPLGDAPRQAALFGGQGTEVQLLWLDRKNPTGAAHLYTARIAADLTLLRGPTEVNALDTLDYAAIRLASDDLLTLWTAAVPGQPATPLTLQVIDSTGRPRTALRIAADATLPMLTSDSAGRLHAAWLEPQIGGVYAIRYATLSNQSLDSALISGSVVVGMVAPPSGYIVESTALCSDDVRMYFIWSERERETDTGSIFALSFNSDPIRQITLAAQNGRWPSVLSLAGRCVVGYSAGQMPTLITLRGGEIIGIERFGVAGRTITGSTLAAYNGVWFAWAGADREGFGLFGGGR